MLHSQEEPLRFVEIIHGMCDHESWLRALPEEDISRETLVQGCGYICWPTSSSKGPKVVKPFVSVLDRGSTRGSSAKS